MTETLEEKIQNILPELKKSLKSISDVDLEAQNDLSFKTLKMKIKKPHPYMFFILFNEIGFKIHGQNIFQKSLWHVVLKYKGHYFLVNERFFSIQVFSEEHSEVTEKLVDELFKLLIIACERLDVLLLDFFKAEIKLNRCYINNVYWNVKRVYEFFRDSLLDEEKSKSITDIFRGMKGNESLSFGLIISFFSVCEFILDVFYVFEKLGENFFQFQRNNWYKKFEKVFDTKTNSNIVKIFEDLKELREVYRNAYAHGMTFQNNNPNNLLVNFKGHPVPISYQYISDTIYYGRKHLFNNEDSKKLIQVFESFFDFISNNEPYSLYYKWIETGWEIPLYKDWINRTIDMLKDEDEFLEYAEERAYHEDRVDNRDFL